MATTPTLLSIDEYLRTSYHPDADYVDGEIEERNLGEYEHAKLQHFIDCLLYTSPSPRDRQKSRMPSSA